MGSKNERICLGHESEKRENGAETLKNITCVTFKNTRCYCAQLKILNCLSRELLPDKATACRMLLK